MASGAVPQMQPQRSLFDPRVATKDEFVAKFNQMSRCARVSRARQRETEQESALTAVQGY